MAIARGLERTYATALPAQRRTSSTAIIALCCRVRDSADLMNGSRRDFRFACIACQEYHKQYRHIKV
jgi:hypothetical protein